MTQEQEIRTWHAMWTLYLLIPNGSDLSSISRIDLIHLTVSIFSIIDITTCYKSFILMYLERIRILFFLKGTILCSIPLCG